MIGTTLEYLQEKLDIALQDRLGTLVDTVVLGPMADSAEDDSAKLYLMLAGLREDTTPQRKPTKATADAYVAKRPATKPLHLECTLLLAATGNDYATSLAILSEALIVLRGLNVISPDDLSEVRLPGGHLTLELVTLEPQEQNHLWATIGAKYVPSAVYRLRLVTLSEQRIPDEEVPLIEDTKLSIPNGPSYKADP